MKKVIFISAATLILISCGGEDKKQKVCDCKKLYDGIEAEAKKMEDEGMDGLSAQNKAREEKKSEFDECEKFHAEVGDEKFYEMSQECK